MSKNIVIVADGSFPEHDIPLGYLRNADIIVCCDGSVETIVNHGMIPTALVGDMDSLSDELSVKFADRIFVDKTQETNDLTKAVEWCRKAGYRDIIIVGATGKRDDHTIGNISLLAEYARHMNVLMVTDTGIFYPFLASCRIDAFRGQQVSIFSIDPATEITSSGLKYPLTRKKLNNWWEATLNESLGSHFELSFKNGKVLVFLKYSDPQPPLMGG
jgi:thiamine pyrophosphokinase